MIVVLLQISAVTFILMFTELIVLYSIHNPSDALAQERFTVFGLVSKDDGILKENMAGCLLKYCRLMDLLAVQG